jgi:hypothetical protein
LNPSSHQNQLICQSRRTSGGFFLRQFIFTMTLTNADKYRLLCA